MIRVLIERWLLPGGCEARQRVRRQIAPMLAKPEQVTVLEPA